MQIKFENQQQKAIADLLWDCQGEDEVQEVLNTYGRTAMVVYHMMIAAAYDQVNEITPEVTELLEKF